MTPADAARLLGVAAIFDRRTIGETEARAWADALDDLDPRDCADAIRAHYRDQTTWIMPAHIRERIAAVRRAEAERAKNARQLAAIESAKRDAATEAAARARDEARAAFERAIAERIAACDQCDDQARVLDSTGRPTREHCTHPNARRTA